MGLFSFAKEWGSNLSQLSNSDRMMTNLVGISPKSYHPNVYRGAINYAQELQEKVTKAFEEPLTVVEYTYARMALMAAVSDNAEDFTALQKYVDAIGRLKRSCGHEIRLGIRLDLDEIVEKLRAKDSWGASK